MKLSTLLSHRESLLRQARLANLAFAYAKLVDFTTRVDRAQLRGAVTLRHPAPDLERYCATLATLEGNQSVIEEHFTDEDAMDLADVMAFLSGQREVDLTFQIEDVAQNFLVPLRVELERNGVRVSAKQAPTELPDTGGETSRDCPQIDGKG